MSDSAEIRRPSVLDRFLLVRPGERAAVLWAIGYFFFLFFSYYLLRPVREAMGIARGADKLPWLFTATMVVMLLVNPVHAAAVSRMVRRKFLPRICHFFGANILIFAALFQFLPHHGGVALGYCFFVWLSVFNLFVISVFWGMMADVFDQDQGRRLFGVIAIGGTLGAIAGSGINERMSVGTFGVIDPPVILVISVVVLEMAVFCMLRLANHFRLAAGVRGPKDPGPDPMQGLRRIAQSRYLQLIAVYIVLYSMTSTGIYMMQGTIVEKSFTGQKAQTAAFARIDFWVNVLTLVTQVFVTGRLIRVIGVGGALLVLPVLTVAGLGALALVPAFAVLLVVQVARRGLHYAIDKPARENLYVPLGPDEKYKSKQFIDTFVYRGGDFIGAWMPKWLDAATLPVAIAASLVWIVSGWFLGRRTGRPGGVEVAPPAVPASP